MRRDMELIRKMVLAIEDHPNGWAPDLQLEGYEPGQIGYHAYLLVDSGLAKGDEVQTRGSSSPEYLVTCLTSAGHDFAASLRNKFIWNEVREEMKQKGVVSVTLDILKRLADKHLRKRLEAE